MTERLSVKPTPTGRDKVGKGEPNSHHAYIQEANY